MVFSSVGWSGGAMVLGKRRPANLHYSRTRASTLAVGAGWGCLRRRRKV